MTFNIKNMLNADVYDHPVSNIELIETHISWVVLTGQYAYKIKKPVNFGFLNFSTLEKRKKYCEQELQLNRRLAPDIYLNVVPISGTIDKPRIASSNIAFEYAVKMRQFPQSAQLDNMLEAGELENTHIDAIASMVASFHQNTAVAAKNTSFGSPENILKPVAENFEQISKILDSNTDDNKLDQIKQWSIAEYERLKPILIQRKQQGFIRECHGDMHLRNLVWLNNKAVAFDCIEFDENFRWIDVISEITFLMMDLQDRQQPRLANLLLNVYLEKTGDYEGIQVLSFYLCYRAMVRAKVEILRITQTSEESNTENLSEYQTYIELAFQYTQPIKQKLIIMRGLSASGKSTVSQQLLEYTGAIRIRSDVERKRLFDISLPDVENDASQKLKQAQGINIGLYSKEASAQTYNKLLQLSSVILSAGHSALIDAAFLERHQREPFQKLASQVVAKRLFNYKLSNTDTKISGKPLKSRGVSFVIIEVSASFDVLRQRIIERKNDVSDADLNVLENQISHWKPLFDDEKLNCISINTEKPLDIKTVLVSLNNL